MFYDLQQRLARLGFISTPITEAQYDYLVAVGYDEDAIEAFTSDVAAGWSYNDLLTAYE